MHSHQHSFSNFHNHGLKPSVNFHEVKQFSNSYIPSSHVIQNQQTVVHNTNFPGTIPVTPPFGFQHPKTEITIHQNQAINNHFLRSAQLENESQSEAYEILQNDEMVS